MWFQVLKIIKHLFVVMNPSPNLAPTPEVFNTLVLARQWNKGVPQCIMHNALTLQQFRGFWVQKARCMKELTKHSQHEYIIFDVHTDKGFFAFLRAERTPDHSVAIPTPQRVLQDFIHATGSGAQPIPPPTHLVEPGAPGSEPQVFDLNNISGTPDPGSPAVHALGLPDVSTTAATPTHDLTYESHQSANSLPEPSPTGTPTTPISRRGTPISRLRVSTPISDSKLGLIDMIKVKDFLANDHLQIVQQTGGGTTVYTLNFSNSSSGSSPSLTDVLAILGAVSMVKDKYNLLNSNCYFFAAATMNYLAYKWPPEPPVPEPLVSEGLGQLIRTWLLGVDTVDMQRGLWPKQTTKTN
ncbi:hypothetical protein BD779DRAFT_1471488 [Infundibulicybe gibba]|nr:hypothetical protein BD779DRAFT_1471488 [Infundibulicybe gibba]